MKYFRAARWIFYGWLLRKLHLPKRWVHEVEDQASMRMFDCALDFQPVGRTAPPQGWSCPHFAITSGAGLITAPEATCRCKMLPFGRTRATTS